jgi:hypothetical protein
MSRGVTSCLMVPSSRPRSIICRRIRWICSRTARVFGDLNGGPPCNGSTAGQTINVPANAPHAFTNAGEAPARLLCLCAPAGQEEFFTLVGQPVTTRTEPPPPLDAEAQAAFVATSRALAPRYKTELLPPPSHD